MFIFILILLSLSFTHSHLVFHTPQVWGINHVSLEQPLDSTTQNWMCAGKQPDNNKVFHFIAGNTYSFEIICGERNANSKGCLIGDWHTGKNTNDYSGCVLGVSYSNYTNPSNHRYLSFSHNCPKRGTNTTFTIASNVQNCDKCVCTWGWAPSRKYSSPAQYYHNCFYCSISGGNNSTMQQFDFINVKNAKYKNKVYNDFLKLCKN